MKISRLRRSLIWYVSEWITPDFIASELIPWHEGGWERWTSHPPWWHTQYYPIQDSYAASLHNIIILGCQSKESMLLIIKYNTVYQQGVWDYIPTPWYQRTGMWSYLIQPVSWWFLGYLQTIGRKLYTKIYSALLRNTRITRSCLL